MLVIVDGKESELEMFEISGQITDKDLRQIKGWVFPTREEATEFVISGGLKSLTTVGCKCFILDPNLEHNFYVLCISCEDGKKWRLGKRMSYFTNRVVYYCDGILLKKE